MPTPRRLALLAAVLAALLFAAPAGAHVRTGSVAVTYRVAVEHVPRFVSARVYPGDRALRLTAAPGHTVVVLGLLGEPFIRIDSHGVTVSKRSPTAQSAKARVKGRSVIWHDPRLTGGLDPRVHMARWTIRLVVDGRPARLSGTIERVPVPSPWPWIALGVPFVAAAVVALRRRGAIEPGADVLGALVGVAILATAAGFAFDANASESRWVEAGNEVVFAAVALVVLARGRAETRALAAGALGLLGLAVGATKIPVFTHGVVLSLLPAEVARTAVALMLWSSAAAAAVGAAVFARTLDDEPESL